MAKPRYIVVALSVMSMEHAAEALSMHAENGYRVISTVVLGVNVVWTLELQDGE